jgi:HEAT repeat protein
MSLPWQRIRLLLTVFLLFSLWEKIVVAQNSPQSDSQTAALINSLWSSDESTRKRAKDELAEIGSNAGIALVQLLEDILRDSHPRFAQGKEDIGRRTLDEMEQSLSRGELKQDALDVLANVKAVNAVRTLVRLTVARPVVGGIGRVDMTPEMQCLIKIGKPAVPALIDLIDTAQEEASKLMDEGVLHDGIGRERVIDAYGKTLQRRIITTLGKIGDRSALPALSRFLRNNNDEALDVTASEAVREITSSN